MPNRGHLVQVAQQLEGRLNGKAFLTISRFEITQLLRDVSSEDTTRLKKGLAEDLERALLEQGVRVYPRLQDTTTDDYVRLIRPRTVAASVVDIIMNPSESTDKQLAEVTMKVKGMWNWSA